MTTHSLALRIGRQIRGVDRVWLAIGAVFAALALTIPHQAADSLGFTLAALWSIAPFFLLSVLFAAALSATGVDRRLGDLLRGRQSTMIAVAAVFGALSPFCSVSVIPLAFALLRSGVPLAPVMAFWIGSPLMDPEMFILTLAIIDLPFSLARAMSAIALGLLAGYATQALSRHRAIADPLKNGIRAEALESVWCSASAPAEGRTTWMFWRDRVRRAAFAAQAVAIGAFLLKWLTFAFAVESLMVAYLPADLIAERLGGDAWWIIPVSVLVGIPSYLNGYAAIPTVSALLDMGMQPGAALAFMTAGEVTSIPTAMSVYVLVNRTVFGWYLLLGVTGSLLVGFAYQAWIAL